jgi:hypothetical protein
MQPSVERIAAIQSALKAHGYEPGNTWKQTQEVCRKIADEHMWQTDHAPDARVLILLGRWQGRTPIRLWHRCRVIV